VAQHEKGKEQTAAFGEGELAIVKAGNGWQAHVHSKSVSMIIGNVMRRAGVPGTPHGIRHSFGTNLVRDGADLRTAQSLLRHSNLQTTAVYVEVADERRGEAIHRLDPFG
jgi:site-specific recombinase XerD